MWDAFKQEIGKFLAGVFIVAVIVVILWLWLR